MSMLCEANKAMLIYSSKMQLIYYHLTWFLLNENSRLVLVPLKKGPQNLSMSYLGSAMKVISPRSHAKVGNAFVVMTYPF